MIGPNSWITKFFLLLFLLIIFFIYLDISLFLRIKNYPIERNFHLTNNSKTTLKYSDVTYVNCHVNPICLVTVKALMLDHINFYLFSPLAILFDDFTKISQSTWISANLISFFHVFVAALAGRMVACDEVGMRRFGVLLFQVRTFLDDLDGHVARKKKKISGQRSEIGTSGYYVDGICDAIGCVFLMAGVFIFLKNNPPRRGYTQLQPILPTNNSKSEYGVIYKVKVTTKKVARKVGYFTAALLLSSTAWNRYIAYYQDILEKNDVTFAQFERQNYVMKSAWFFAVTWIWRIVNVHAMLHFLLLSILIDKLWDFLKTMQYLCFVILLLVICGTELHLWEAQRFIFESLAAMK